MPSIDAVRLLVSRHVEDSGRVIDSALVDDFNLSGTLGEVLSLSPVRVETLAGETVKPKAYVGPVPAVGDLVLLIRVARWWLAVTGIQVI